VISQLLASRLAKEDHIRSENEQHGAVANVSEHYAKEEWECYTCNDCWVRFLVKGSTVGINYCLKNTCELIIFEVSWTH